MKNFFNYFNQDYFDLLVVMTNKEIKSRYKGAFIGFLWIFINPLIQMLIIGFVFSFFIKVPNYFLFLFVGLLPWQFFTTSFSKATPSIVNERSLIQKARFAKEVIPLSIVLSGFVNLLISMGLLILYLLITQQILFSSLFYIAISLIWLLIFTCSISLLTSSLNVRYRDVAFFVQSILVLWFYATPVLYTLNQVSENALFFFALNPLVSIFEILHKSILNNGLLTQQILIPNIGITLFLLFLSIYTYRKLHKDFVDWL